MENRDILQLGVCELQFWDEEESWSYNRVLRLEKILIDITSSGLRSYLLNIPQANKIFLKPLKGYMIEM
jgi:hypothetical protein